MTYKDIHTLAKNTEITINGIKLTLDKLHPFILKKETHTYGNNMMTNHDTKIIQDMLAEDAKNNNPELSEIIDEYVQVTQSEL